MARYRRYGYVVVQRSFDKDKTLLACANVAYQHNPEKINQYVDDLLAEYTDEMVADVSIFIPVEDREENVPFPMRDVFIKYPNGESETIRVEGWFVWVGKD